MRIDAHTSFADLVAADIGKEGALKRVGQRQIDIVENLTAAAMQDQCPGTILFDDPGHVGSKNQTAIGALIEQLFLRPLLKALISDRDDFVDEIAIEIDGQRQRKIEECPHPGRIGPDRFRQEGPELGEIVDVVANLAECPVVHAADQADVVIAGHASANPAAQPDRT